MERLSSQLSVSYLFFCILQVIASGRLCYSVCSKLLNSNPCIKIYLIAATPEIPRISNVESDNPTALTIEWSPAQNGSRPNSFNVAISNYGVSDPLHSASVAVGDGRSLPYSYTFTGLISDTDYEISVVAINCAGNSTVCKPGVKTGD